MPSTKYTYSKATPGDFDSGFDARRLEDDVQKSAITIALDYVDTEGDTVNVWFKDVLPDTSLLTAVVAAHTGVPLVDAITATLDGPKTADKKIIAAMWPTEGSKTTFISPNWADPTTWYHCSVRVTDEVAAVKVADQYDIYKLVNQNVIDTCHAKLSQEDYLTDKDGNSLRVAVTVNDEAVVEVDPHTNTGAFTVDYLLGELTFAPVLQSGDVVKVTYNYENGSCWVLAPKPGKVLKIRKVEVQFSGDIELTDTVVFEPWISNPMDPGGPKIPLSAADPTTTPDKIKSMMDYINDANGAYPVIPALGGEGWRGTSQPVHTFPWDYQALTDIKSAYGAEIRVRLEHDVPFGGTVAVATFYCLSVDE